ncbi:BLUF domain-containing protein [Hymenobacter sp. UYCo722]|uniref:BLUF domain-containing protein n=1 Tax=Hymenobacter sp. UYCo722 TaxID=3156335 RepID=UPI00339762CB
METYRITYASTAARSFGSAEFERLLMQARIYNYSEGIGGLLLRAGPQFLGVLEGPEPAVATLYARIAADPRHHAVRALEAAAVRGPLFPYASLGFAEVAPDALVRLTACLDQSHRRVLPPQGYDEPEVIADLLLEFVELHCSHVLGQPGDRAAHPPQRSPSIQPPNGNSAKLAHGPPR